MTSKSDGAGRRQLLLVALVFLGPLIAAAWMYFSESDWAPGSSTNHGRLLEPFTNLNDENLQRSFRDLGNGEINKYWILVYSNAAECRESCRKALFRQRQIRLMLGGEMGRVLRVFLHGAASPDKVVLDQQHRGLKTINDIGLGNLLQKKRPADLPEGGLYLIDPLGNLVMYFADELAPGDVVDDIKHLLSLSRIG